MRSQKTRKATPAPSSPSGVAEHKKEIARMNDNNQTPTPPAPTPPPAPKVPGSPAPDQSPKKDPSTGDKLYGWGKNNEIILYLFFGVLTTAINFLSYLFFFHVVKLELTISVLIAWFVSVLFAYITNKIWVFKKRGKSPKKVVEEASLFFAVRGISGLLDLALMWILVTQLGFHDVWMKLWVNVLIVIINYITSKLWVFQKESDKNKKASKKDQKKSNKK